MYLHVHLCFCSLPPSLLPSVCILSFPRKLGRGIGKDNIHTEGRREGGREQKHRQTCMYTHQHAHPSQLQNCEDVIPQAEAYDTHCSRSFRQGCRKTMPCTVHMYGHTLNTNAVFGMVYIVERSGTVHTLCTSNTKCTKCTANL